MTAELRHAAGRHCLSSASSGLGRCLSHASRRKGVQPRCRSDFSSLSGSMYQSMYSKDASWPHSSFASMIRADSAAPFQTVPVQQRR